MSNTRKGENLMKRLPPKSIRELEVEVTRLRAENARLKLEKEIVVCGKSRAAIFAVSLALLAASAKLAAAIQICCRYEPFSKDFMISCVAV